MKLAKFCEVDEFEIDEVSAIDVMVVVPDVEVRLMLPPLPLVDVDFDSRELPEIKLLSAEVIIISPPVDKRLLAILVEVEFADLFELVL